MHVKASGLRAGSRVAAGPCKRARTRTRTPPDGGDCWGGEAVLTNCRRCGGVCFNACAALHDSDEGSFDAGATRMLLRRPCLLSSSSSSTTTVRVASSPNSSPHSTSASTSRVTRVTFPHYWFLQRSTPVWAPCHVILTGPLCLSLPARRHKQRASSAVAPRPR